MIRYLKYYLITLASIIYSGVYAQTTVTGKVLNQRTKNAIPSTSVTAINTKDGTLSDANGNFKFDLRKQERNDTLSFASVGFKPRKLALKDLKPPFEVFLEEDIKTLTEVNISSKRNELKIGNFNVGSTIFMQNFGAQYAKKFEMPSTHQYLKEILILRSFDFYPHSPETIFRINVYDQDPQTKGPGKRICLDTIEVHDLNNAQINVDVTKYNISIQNPIFFVAIETIPIPYNERYWLYRPDVYEDGIPVYPAYYEICYQPHLSIGHSKDDNGWVLSLEPGSDWYKSWYVPAIKLVVN